jgi:hypothetical protein
MFGIAETVSGATLIPKTMQQISRGKPQGRTEFIVAVIHSLILEANTRAEVAKPPAVMRSLAQANGSLARL